MTDQRRTTALRRGTRRSARGLVLLAFLLTLALTGIGLMAATDVWSLSRQRLREQELLFVGDQYRLAIQRYYFGAPPGTPRVLPSGIQDLLEDDRYPMPVRYLRRQYNDPITGSAEWGVVRSGNRLSGVYSFSENPPLKQAGFAPGYELFKGTTSYRDWVFAVSPKGEPITVNPAAPDSPASGLAPSDPRRPARRTPS